MDYEIIDQTSAFAKKPAVSLWRDIWARIPAHFYLILGAVGLVAVSAIYSRWSDRKAHRTAWIEHRKQAGIPPSDQRPWNIAFADAQRRKAREAARKKLERPRYVSQEIGPNHSRRLSSSRRRDHNMSDSRRSSFIGSRASSPRLSHMAGNDRRPSYLERSPTPRLLDRSSSVHPFGASSAHEPSTHSVFVSADQFQPRQPAISPESARKSYIQKRGPAFARRASELYHNDTPDISQDAKPMERRAKRSAQETSDESDADEDIQDDTQDSFSVSAPTPRKRTKQFHGDENDKSVYSPETQDRPSVSTSTILPGGLPEDQPYAEAEVEDSQKPDTSMEDSKSDVLKPDSTMEDTFDTQMEEESTFSDQRPTKAPKVAPSQLTSSTSSTSPNKNARPAVTPRKSLVHKSPRKTLLRSERKANDEDSREVGQRVPTWIPWSPIKRKPGDSWRADDGENYMIGRDGKERKEVEIKQWKSRKELMPAGWKNDREANLKDKVIVKKWLTYEELEKAQKLNLLANQPDVDHGDALDDVDFPMKKRPRETSVYYQRGAGTPQGRRSRSSSAVATLDNKLAGGANAKSRGNLKPGAARLRNTSSSNVKPVRNIRTLPRPATPAEKQEMELSKPKKETPKVSSQQTQAAPVSAPSAPGTPSTFFSDSGVSSVNTPPSLFLTEPPVSALQTPGSPFGFASSAPAPPAVVFGNSSSSAPSSTAASANNSATPVSIPNGTNQSVPSPAPFSFGQTQNQNFTADTSAATSSFSFGSAPQQGVAATPQTTAPSFGNPLTGTSNNNLNIQNSFGGSNTGSANRFNTNSTSKIPQFSGKTTNGGGATSFNFGGQSTTPSPSFNFSTSSQQEAFGQTKSTSSSAPTFGVNQPSPTVQTSNASNSSGVFFNVGSSDKRGSPTAPASGGASGKPRRPRSARH